MKKSSTTSTADFGTTKADEIRQQIEELIVAGRLPAGAVLRQDDLARRFDVSRTPIREALRQLAAIGLVTFVPNRGVRVRALDRDDWTQTFRARAALEGATAEAAALRITVSELEQLDAADDDFGCQIALLRRRDIDQSTRDRAAYGWVAANDRFHGIIIGAAGMPLLEELIGGLRRAFSGEAGWAEGSAADALYETNLRQHAAIRAAFHARNAAAARTLMEDHILDSWRLLQAILDEAETDQQPGPPAVDVVWSPAAAVEMTAAISAGRNPG